MTPEDIRAKIIQAGTSQTAIAKFLKVRPASVGRVITGAMRSQRIEVELEKIIGGKVFAEPPKKRGRPKTVWTGQIAPQSDRRVDPPNRRVGERRGPKGAPQAAA